MKKIKRMEFDEHVELGNRLKADKRHYGHVYLAICAKYGKTSREAHAMERLIKGFDHVKNVLDDCVCGEYPKKPDNEVVSVYY